GTTANPNRAAADIKRPPVVNPLAPYLSERKPLNGPTVTKATANGISRIPDVSASKSSAPWKNMVSTREIPLLDMEARKLLNIPAVKGLILNSFKSINGVGVLNST